MKLRTLSAALTATGLTFGLNASFSTVVGTYSSPSTGAAAQPMQIGAAGNLDSPLPADSRIGSFLAWTVRLSTNQLTEFYAATLEHYQV